MVSACDGYLMSVVRMYIKKEPIHLLSSDELKTYDHSACDIKVKIVIDFSYLNECESLKVRVSQSRNYVFFGYFLVFLIFCDVRRKGWGYAHIWEMCVSGPIWGRHNATGFWVD